jgi:hypothetical protein
VNNTSGTSGADGTSGRSGTAGTSGTASSSGASAGSGSSGTSGTAGTSGTSGRSGNLGTSGTFVSVTGTLGLTGGGALSTDRTISVNAANLTTVANTYPLVFWDGVLNTFGDPTAPAYGTPQSYFWFDNVSKWTKFAAGVVTPTSLIGVTASGEIGLTPVTIGTSGTSGVSITGAAGTSGTSGRGGTAGTSGIAGVQGNNAGLRYNFSTTTTDSDPGNGTFRYNNATVGSVTQIYIDLTDVSVTDISAFIDTWDDSTSAVKGYIIIDSNANLDVTFTIFQLNSITTVAGYRKLNVTYLSGTAPSNFEECVIQFYRNGDTGTSGTSGVSGTSGTSGTSGRNGTSGTSGISGTAGTSGITGTAGTSGTSAGGGAGLNPTPDYLPFNSAGTSFDDSTLSQDASGAIHQHTAGGNGEIWADGNIIAYYSDERLKKDFENITDALDKVKSLRAVTYYQNEIADEYLGTNLDRQVGVIAQDILKVLPEAVKKAPFDRGIDENGNTISKTGENYLTVQYEKIVPLLVAAINELTDEIARLKQK